MNLQVMNMREKYSEFKGFAQSHEPPHISPKEFPMPNSTQKEDQNI
jgi:hypothetical protein